MLTARRLGWLPSHNDVPVEVRAETIGPGEDIQIRLKDDVVVEVQAKKMRRAVMNSGNPWRS